MLSLNLHATRALQDLRILMLRGMQHINSELPRQHMPRDESCMIVEEEQLCDWTDMSSAFFRGHGKGCIHMSVYLQPTVFSKNAFSST